MGKIAGKPDTRAKIAIQHAAITSFAMPWDKAANGFCCIKGCNHRASGLIGDLGDGQYCSSGNVGLIVDNRKPMDGDPYVGVACPHCTDQILDDDPKGR